MVKDVTVLYYGIKHLVYFQASAMFICFKKEFTNNVHFSCGSSLPLSDSG